MLDIDTSCKFLIDLYKLMFFFKVDDVFHRFSTRRATTVMIVDATIQTQSTSASGVRLFLFRFISLVP